MLEEKKLKTSRQSEKWVEVPARKDNRKKKTKPETKKPERPSWARSEAMLIKLSEGVSS